MRSRCWLWIFSRIFILKRALAAAFPGFLRWTLINIIQGQFNDCEIKEAIFATGELKVIATNLLPFSVG